MTAERDYHIVQAEGLFDKLTAAETALSAKTAEWAEGLSAKAIWRNAFKEWQMRAESLDGKLTASEAARGKAVDALVKIARPGDFTLPAEIARDCLETLAEPGKAGES
jgi:hypothetical protein